MSETIWLLVLLLIVIVAWMNFTPDRTPPDADHLDEAARSRLDAKRRRALAKMKAHGIKAITERVWVGSMHDAPSLKKRASLTVIGGKHGRV